MYREERHKMIMEILEEDQYTSVSKLSKELYVSLPTIRRDLTELQRQGLVLRSHGGVKKVSDGHFEIPFLFRSGFKNEEKRALCKAASKLIRPDSVIFIDESTTLLPICRMLAETEKVTVITNGISTAALLQEFNINAYCTGGRIRSSSQSCVGPHAERLIDMFHFDIAFFSAYGFSKEGLTETSMHEAELKRAVLNNASKKVFLADSDKFNRVGPYRIARASDMDVIITNGDIPMDIPTENTEIIRIKSDF